jgi:hypothetical protein
MEFILNLGWAMLSLWMLCAWVRMTPRKAGQRRLQMVALAIVILVLLPAISMTDDLAAAHNPAEIDCCARRHHDHSASSSHVVPVSASLPVPNFAGLRFDFADEAVPSDLPPSFVQNPAVASIRNRPPPAA